MLERDEDSDEIRNDDKIYHRELSQKGAISIMALRNLYDEFKRDNRMSPTNKAQRGLGDDWTLERDIPSDICLKFNVPHELCRFRFHIIADAPHRYSQFARPGRILRIEAPEIRGAKIQELRRGLSLGEAWDLTSFHLTDEEIMYIALAHFKIPTISEYDIIQRNHIEAMKRLEEDRINEQQAIVRDGRFIIGGTQKKPTLLWQNANARAHAMKEAERKEEGRRQREVLARWRPIFKIAINHEESDQALEAVKAMMKDDDEEEFFDILMKSEIGLLQKRIDKLNKKSEELDEDDKGWKLHQIS